MNIDQLNIHDLIAEIMSKTSIEYTIKEDGHVHYAINGNPDNLKSIFDAVFLPADKNTNLIVAIKEDFVLKYITQNPVVLEFLLRGNKDGGYSFIMDGDKPYVSTFSGSRVCDFLNKEDHEKFYITDSFISIYSKAYYELCMKIGLGRFPCLPHESIAQSVFINHPEAWINSASNEELNSLIVFTKYNQSSTPDIKKMFADLIVRSPFLMSRKDNPLSPTRNKNDYKFHLTFVSFAYTYSIGNDTTSYEGEDDVVFMSMTELGGKDVKSLLSQYNLPMGGELLDFCIISRSINVGSKKYLYAQKKGDSFSLQHESLRFDDIEKS